MDASISKKNILPPTLPDSCPESLSGGSNIPLRYLKNFLDYQDLAIIAFDPKGCITFWNKGASCLFDFKEADIIGAPGEALEPEETRGETATLLAKVFKGEAVERHETVRKSGAGRVMEVEISAYLLESESGAAGEVITFIKDISERKRLERQVREYGDNLRRLFDLLTYQRRILANSSLEEIIRAVELVGRDIFKGGEVFFIAPNSTVTDLVLSSEATLPQKVNRRVLANLLHWTAGISEAMIYSNDRNRPSNTPLDEFLKAFRSWYAFPLFFEKRCFAFYVIAYNESMSLSRVDSEFFHNLLALVSGPVWHALRFEEHLESSRTYSDGTSFLSLVGQSRKMQQIYNLIRDIAATTATVLITGENGTGKQLVAQSIHALSTRRDGPFIVANCSAYPSSLIESEFFGHEKGAFTGAVRRKLGRLDLAQGGTIFLDEIGELPLATQVSLLRILQDKCYERVGGEKTIVADVRIIAATNRNLKEEMTLGNFREDLFYRLNVISIHLPPLRERKEDILPLCSHFLAKYGEREGKNIQEFSRDAIQVFLDYDWPGNVRELQNAVEYAVILTKGNVIRKNCLPAHIRESYVSPSSSLAENEKKLIAKVLEECSWNKHEAARKLKITRSTLYSKVKRYGLR